MISSQLDADRLDYLLRDSYAAGVLYGWFDLEWLLHSIRVGLVELPGVAGRVPRLCFATLKARSVVEQYVLARQSIYLQVYTHKTTRAYEALLHHTLGLARYVLGHGSSLPDSTPMTLLKALMREPLSLDEYLDLDDCLVWTALRGWAQTNDSNDPALSLLGRKAEALVNRRRPYRTVELRNRASQEAALLLEQELQRDGGLEQFSCHRDIYEDVPYRNILYARGRGSEDGLLEEERARPIYLIDSQGDTRPAEAESDTIDALARTQLQVRRFYYDDHMPGIEGLVRGRGIGER